MTASALTRPGERDRLTVKIGQIDWTFCFLVCLIAAMGGLMLYSIANASWQPWANSSKVCSTKARSSAWTSSTQRLPSRLASLQPSTRSAAGEAYLNDPSGSNSLDPCRRPVLRCRGDRRIPRVPVAGVVVLAGHITQ